MTILSLEHAEPRIEGYLCRHLTKIRPGIFVGRISAVRRTAIWKHILAEQPDVDAVLCYQSDHEQIRFESNGSPTRKVSEIDGIQYISRGITHTELWRQLLAKPEHISHDSGIYHAGKPLYEHLFETGLFAKILLTNSAYTAISHTLHETVNGITEQQLVDSICYLAALHDIGKISPYFQAKIDVDDVNVLFGAKPSDGAGFRHEAYSKTILQSRILPSHKVNRHTKNLLAAVIGDHHQCKSDNAGDNYPPDTNIDQLKRTIDELEQYVINIFPFTPFEIISEHENIFCQLLSGIIRLSDWSASSFAIDLTSDGKTDEEYARSVVVRCQQYIANGGLNVWRPNGHYDYADLFSAFSDGTATLRPLQRMMINVISDHPHAECVIIESEPGSGKTEAGLYTAMNLLHKNNLQGLYFALPTGATAEAMLPRLQELQNKTGAWDDTDLRLFTSMAWMRDGSSDDADSKSDWTKSGPRKLFSKLACGTVDQLMAAGEKLKAGDMRLLALSNKCIVIDEFHAYDAYMLDILLVILKWCRELHVPVIILSATLRQDSIRKICAVYGSVPDVMSNSYPLITVAENGNISQYECESTFHKTYPVKAISQDDLADGILTSVEHGGNTLYIANTVKRALSIYNYLLDKISDDTELHIFTASTTPANREKMGAEIVYRYGKSGKRDGRRPQKSILIATQLMEMSMDVDFDTMFSDLAPADSILQRVGRMCRHDDAGTIRKAGFKSIFYLVLPNHNEFGWALPYSESVMAATEDVLKYVNHISVPGNIRPLIENTYGAAGEEWILEEQQKSAAARGKIIGLPGDSYTPEPFLRTMADTRLSPRESVNVLCLSDDQVNMLPSIASWEPSRSKKWCEEIIAGTSVKTYCNKLSRLDVVDMDGSIRLPIWIRDYEVVRNHAEYWHGDCTFFT